MELMMLFLLFKSKIGWNFGGLSKYRFILDIIIIDDDDDDDDDDDYYMKNSKYLS